MHIHLFFKFLNVTYMSKVTISFVKISGTSQKCNNVATPYPIFTHYLSRGCLREVKKQGNFHTFSSKSGHGRLREVLNIVIWCGNFRYFRKLVAEERCSFARDGRNRWFHCINITQKPTHWWTRHGIFIGGSEKMSQHYNAAWVEVTK